jgi:hypothetical protein
LAVELVAETVASKTIAFTCAAAGRARHARRAGAGGAARASERWHVRVDIRFIVGFRIRLVDGGIAEALGKFINGGVAVALNEVGRLDWIVRLRGLDLRRRDTASMGHLLGHAARATRATLLGAGGLGLGAWNIKDVELALSSWLQD